MALRTAGRMGWHPTGAHLTRLGMGGGARAGLWNIPVQRLGVVLIYSPRRMYGVVMTKTLERTVGAAPDRVWELWTTPEGISAWWAPEGFRTDVTRLDLEPGGELVYTMTAVGPEQIAFMEQNGMPLVTESRKRFTEIVEPSRLCYRSLVDFVPDHAAYEQLTEIELHPVAGGTRIVMKIEPMHDDVWTERLVAGRSNELDNLSRLLS